MARQKKTLSADVAIAGGGMVGLTLGIGLAQSGLSVVVIDAAPQADLTEPAFDGRSSAIAFASYKLLQGVGIWPHLADKAEPILEIRVTDGPSRQFLHFDQAALGDGPLGYMVENRHTRMGLFARALELDNLRIIAPDKASSFTAETSGARLTLESGTVIEAPLVVGAEGRASPLRQWAGIPTRKWQYNQSGIVATIQHELPHCNVAHERFLAPGPFAILPLKGNRSSLVWTVDPALAEEIMALSPRAFLAEVEKRVGGFLGKLKVIGPRWTYPLGLQFAQRYIDPRLALVGDAAHGIHPIAGQGLNLGLRDVAALIEVVVDARRLGGDIGAADVLERYQRWRHADSLALALATDGLNRLFSNDIAPIRALRDMGLAAINRMPSAKRFFMRHARGTVGKLPKLLKGEAV